MKQVFKKIIANFHERTIRKVIKRDLEVDLKAQKIITITGPRRAGKSSYLFGLMRKIIDTGVDKTDIVYINFEDERIDIESKDLQVLLDAYLELYPDKNLKNTYLFLDEIQSIDDWEQFVNRIYEQGTENIFLTGSNSKLLSQEIATCLRGRTITYKILPLSFQEWLRFKGQKPNINSTKGQAKIINLQEEYMQRGGFPEIVNVKKETKLKILQEYFDVMIYNDLIERYNISKPYLLKEFTKQLLQTSTKEFSVNKLSNMLKSRGLKFNKNLLYKFLEYLKNAYFIGVVSKFDYSLRKQGLKKSYNIDNGFLNSISFKFSSDSGKLLENMVYVELYRRYEKEIYFLKNGYETDFVVNCDKFMVFQVCYKLHDDNKKREIKGAMKAMDEFGLDKALIITKDQSEVIKKNNKIIKVKPFYKWVSENLK